MLHYIDSVTICNQKSSNFLPVLHHAATFSLILQPYARKNHSICPIGFLSLHFLSHSYSCSILVSLYNWFNPNSPELNEEKFVLEKISLGIYLDMYQSFSNNVLKFHFLKTFCIPFAWRISSTQKSSSQIYSVLPAVVFTLNKNFWIEIYAGRTTE